ncbi:MAG: hypothetical protein H5U37_05235 [Caldisericia bacterium]|nr:hypothetical protein [Caldisericia bacterium]
MSPRVPIDIFVYTEKEFEEIKKRDFGKSILKDGIVIYEKKRRRSKKVD